MSKTKQIIKAAVFQPPNIFMFSDMMFENPLESDRIKIIYMNEIGILTDDDSNYEYIGTCAIATCIALIARCNETRITVVAHFSDCTDVQKSIPLLNELLGSATNVDVWLIGGFVGYSESLFDSLVSLLDNLSFPFNIKEVSVMRSFVCKSVAINTKTGEIYDYVRYSKDMSDLCVTYKLPIDINKFIDTDMSQFEIRY